MFGVLRPRRARRWGGVSIILCVLGVFATVAAAPALATYTEDPFPPPPPPWRAALAMSSSVHVGDLDGTFTGSTVTVTITVHDASEQPVAGATVNGDFFADGAFVSRTNYTTGSSGTTTTGASVPPNTSEVTFTVLSVSFAGSYDPAANHDPDGNSDGTTITLRRMHVGDLDGTSTKAAKGQWKATVTITVHDPAEQPVVGATVTGAFSGWSSTTCTTGSFGTCTVESGKLPSTSSAISFSVGGYDPATNHDPDGDSDGTTITVFKP